MENLPYVICFIFMLLIPILVVYKSTKDRIRKQKDKEKTDKDWEVSAIVRNVINFDAELLYGDFLKTLQNNRLQKIKAICGHLGVQVEIENNHITPSIEIIRSLSFMKEYLPQINEEWMRYEKSDPCLYTKKFWKKRSALEKEMEKVSVEEWKSLNSEEKRLMIHNLSEKYDQKYKRNQK